VIINKGHNLIAYLNKLIDKYILYLLGVFLGNKVKGYYLIESVEYKAR